MRVCSQYINLLCIQIHNSTCRDDTHTYTGKCKATLGSVPCACVLVIYKLFMYTNTHPYIHAAGPEGVARRRSIHIHINAHTHTYSHTQVNARPLSNQFPVSVCTCYTNRLCIHIIYKTSTYIYTHTPRCSGPRSSAPTEIYTYSHKRSHTRR